MVDALDLGSSAAMCEGSSPLSRTKWECEYWLKLVVFAAIKNQQIKILYKEVSKLLFTQKITLF